jgi:hypothetical protein
MILIIILIVYFKDCRKIGKKNLAVPLSDRIMAYIILFIVPLLFAMLK